MLLILTLIFAGLFVLPIIFHQHLVTVQLVLFAIFLFLGLNFIQTDIPGRFYIFIVAALCWILGNLTVLTLKMNKSL